MRKILYELRKNKKSARVKKLKRVSMHNECSGFLPLKCLHLHVHLEFPCLLYNLYLLSLPLLYNLCFASEWQKCCSYTLHICLISADI